MHHCTLTCILISLNLLIWISNEDYGYVYISFMKTWAEKKYIHIYIRIKSNHSIPTGLKADLMNLQNRKLFYNVDRLNDQIGTSCTLPPLVNPWHKVSFCCCSNCNTNSVKTRIKMTCTFLDVHKEICFVIPSNTFICFELSLLHKYLLIKPSEALRGRD